MNSRKLLLTFVASSVLSFFSPEAVRADLVIDDFSLPMPAIDYAIAPGPNPTIIQTDLGGGLTRTITMQVTSPNPPRFNALTGSVAGLSGFSASFDILSSGKIMLAYSYDSIQNFTPNGTDVGTLQFYSSANSGFSPNLPLAISFQTTTGDRTFNGFLSPTNQLTSVNVALSAFAGSGDFTQVTGVTFNLTAGQAADLVLDKISVSPINTTNAIPAPAGVWLALSALPLLGVRRLRRKA